ncbi:MAG: hypothetical protein ISS92_02790 [Candidatus Omnitrophica bacterium]|nr:hypothetical protein [Candidatus Omnitrophota bacterium]
MKKEKFLKNLNLLGYPLFDSGESVDANETLAEVVKSKNPRMQEGFPLLLANSLEENYFKNVSVEKHLTKKADKTYYRRLVLLSLALYKYLKLDYPWVDKLGLLPFFDEKLLRKYFECFAKKAKLTKDVKELSSDRMVTTFKRYFRESSLALDEYVEMKKEADLEYSLSRVFSKKQKELFLKKLKGEKMTKTEREYYSRSVKKKVLALANPGLHDLASKLAKE